MDIVDQLLEAAQWLREAGLRKHLRVAQSAYRKQLGLSRKEFKGKDKMSPRVLSKDVLDRIQHGADRLVKKHTNEFISSTKGLQQQRFIFTRADKNLARSKFPQTRYFVNVKSS